MPGNKRVALVVALLLLSLNGLGLAASQEEFYQVFMALAGGHLEEPALASWFVDRTRPPQ